MTDALAKFLLAHADWSSAMVLARCVGGVNSVASALDATERLRAALDSYAMSVAGTPEGIDSIAYAGRLRDRLAAAQRWLYGSKRSGQVPAVKPDEVK